MKKKQDILLKGIGASPGIVIGNIFHYKDEYTNIKEISISEKDIEKEIERLKTALKKSELEITKILQFAKEKLPEHQLRIFDAQILMLQDEYFINGIFMRIKSELKNAEFILTDEIRKYQEILIKTVKDDYLRERAFDVEDVKNRVIRNLNIQNLPSKIESSVIIVAKRLSPADTVIFSNNNILGYATDFGGYTSHTAILSRSLNIPCVVGLKEITEMISDDSIMILDGYGGNVIINPSEESINEYKAKLEKHRKFEISLMETSKLPPITIDKREFSVVANVEVPDELDFALSQGTDGIGLYRTEQMVIYKGSFPSEEEQYLAYRQVADKMNPRPVTFRTFDVGGDKVLPSNYQENNPFLGWRGIRISLEKPEIFLNQLRALLRASVNGNVKIMFPMISTLSEIKKAKEYVELAKKQLDEKKIPYDKDIKVGVMIEVPSAAVLANLIAKEVDFISIGTNDLIQYLLAVDRGNVLVSHLFQEFDPSVIRTVKFIIDEAHKAGQKISMCGEMAANPITTMLLIALGLDEFSVVPSRIPEIKKIIQSVTVDECKKVLENVLSMDEATTIKNYLEKSTKEKFPDFILDD
ncbi:MAG TPA: phosphoenolpyruvate--protein phosphotransferase [Bacteroidota bacterium]|jgi:phosphotransferase system enzyme I (PtsI)|nr:phosphoenolpyruvate--protein phosphotransferase [Bacteroidota bacterium]